METILSGKSSFSTSEKFLDLYWDDLINFYNEVVTNQIEKVECYPLFSWSIPTPLRIAVVGEYNHGKSSVINFLLGRKGLLPVSPRRETKITTYVFSLYYSNFNEFGVNQEHAILFNTRENSSRIIQLLDLKSIINDPALSPENYVLYVYLNNPLLDYNVVFIDTPGFKVEKDTEWYPLELAKLSDLIILVSDLNKPFTRYHDHFIKVLGPHARKVIHVINKVDLASGSSDIRDALTHVISHQIDSTRSHPRFFISVLDAPVDQNWRKDLNDQEDKPSIEDALFKTREWENKKFWTYIHRQIARDRSMHKSENWALSVIEMSGLITDSKEGELHKVLSEMQGFVRELKENGKAWEDIYHDTIEDRLITNTVIDEKLQELDEAVKKIFYEYSNTANVTITERIGKCLKKKDMENAQRLLKEEIHRQLMEALNQVEAIITDKIRATQVHWFKLMSDIPDGRIIDESLSPVRVKELRSILYDYLFEEQYFWRHSDWSKLLNILEQKGFTGALNRQNTIAWFLQYMRKLYFDCNSSGYLLRKIVSGVPAFEVSSEDRKRILKVQWQEIKAPRLLLFASSIKKYQFSVLERMQKYQVVRFNLSSEVIGSYCNVYRQKSYQVLTELETSLRNTLASQILDVRTRSIQERMKCIAQRLNQIFEDTPLSFQSLL